MRASSAGFLACSMWFVGCSGTEKPAGPSGAGSDGQATGGAVAGAGGNPSSGGSGAGGTPTPTAGAPTGGRTGIAGSNGTGGSGGIQGTSGGRSSTGGAPPAGTGGVVSSAGGAGVGGATAGASTAGSGSVLDPATVIVSDDFDAATANGAPDATKWEAYEAWAKDFAPTVDASKAHSMPNSLRVTSSNVGIGSFLVPKSGLPVADNRFYVRVWINWEKASSTIMGHSGFLVGATARDNSGTEVRLGISNKGPGDQAMMDLNLIGGAGGEVTRYSNGFTDGGDPSGVTGNGFQFAANTWVCLEAYFNGGGHEFRIWADDVEIEAMHVTDFRGSPGAEPRTTWAPTYTFVKIGAQDYDANLGKIWYDDVVIAKTRVGCH